MNILITGVHGFVGSNLVKYLSKENTIYGLEIVHPKKEGVMNGMVKIGGWLHLPLNPLRMQKLTENYVSSNVKIKMALGIDRLPIDAREGLKKTIEYFAKK